jgi:hypothetical protein
MAFAFNTQVMRDGYRNFVIRLTGTCVAGDADLAPAVLIDVTTLNPPCSLLRVDRVKYSLPNGSPLDIQLWWQATSNVLFEGMSGGDDMDVWNFGGLFPPNVAGLTGNIMWGTSGATSAEPTANTVLTFAVIVECVKLQPKYPK